jgi:hypothetical protein
MTDNRREATALVVQDQCQEYGHLRFDVVGRRLPNADAREVGTSPERRVPAQLPVSRNRTSLTMSALSNLF